METTNTQTQLNSGPSTSAAKSTDLGEMTRPYKNAVAFENAKLILPDFGYSKDFGRFIRLVVQAWSDIPETDKAILISKWNFGQPGYGARLELLDSWSSKCGPTDIVQAGFLGAEMRVSADAFDMMDDEFAVALIKKAFIFAVILIEDDDDWDYDRFWNWWSAGVDYEELDIWVDDYEEELSLLEHNRNAALGS